MKIDGGCHCGYIRVEGEADPEKTTVCHCTDCQVGTGSAFRLNVPAPGATFRITGQPATYLKTTAESGNPRLQAFCPRCGSPIYSTAPAELVPLGAALGELPCHPAQEREASVAGGMYVPGQVRVETSSTSLQDHAAARARAGEL